MEDSEQKTKFKNLTQNTYVKGSVIGIGGCLLIIVILPICLTILGISSISDTINKFLALFQSTPPTATIMSTQTLVSGIQPLGQLVSISAQLAKADIQVNIQQGLCSFSANHVAVGTVEAGVDLSQLKPDAVSYDDETKTYTIQLPAPTLHSCRIDYIRQYQRSFTACNVDVDEARLLANYQAVDDFRQDILEGGILSRAQQGAESVIANFVALVTNNSKVNIVFGEPNSDSLPSSCIPQTPQGWVLDEATGEWSKP
jgi:uncharacterized protein DUF4230